MVLDEADLTVGCMATGHRRSALSTRTCLVRCAGGSARNATIPLVAVWTRQDRQLGQLSPHLQQGRPAGPPSLRLLLAVDIEPG